MPWLPDLFNARFVADLGQRQHTDHIAAVPYYDGILAEDPDALVGSFAGVPELHHPVRGRIKGRDAFTRYVQDTADHLRRTHHTVEPVALLVTPRRTVEEVVLRYDSARGKVEFPVAIVTDRDHNGLHELRIYHSTWPITGTHATRPPLLQPDPDAHANDIADDYQRALAAGDVAATVAAFEPDGLVREPAGGCYTHTGTNDSPRSTPSSFPTAAASPSRTAPSPTTDTLAPSSTTSPAGAPRTYHQRPGSPSTPADHRADSPPHASTTTPTHPCNRGDPRCLPRAERTKLSASHRLNARQ